MMQGVKQKFRECFIILNFICGCILYVIYNGNNGGNPFGSKSNGMTPSTFKFNEDAYQLNKKRESNWTRILFWTSYFGDYDFAALKIDQETFRNCPVKCQLTFDKRLFSISDGVVFHARDINRPGNGLPAYHPKFQRWIFFVQESPEYTNLDLTKYANVFNWTMTYRRDSDIYHPYGRIVRVKKDYNRTKENSGNILGGPTAPVSENPKNILYRRSDDELYNDNHMYRKDNGKHNINSHFSSYRTSTKWSEVSKRLLDKPRLVAWVVSHCSTRSNREGLAYELQEYLTIDIYGKCGDLVCPGDTSTECYPLLGKLYKFYLAFENSLCYEYVTEKFFDALRYDIVPVVYGGANYSEVAPPGSFINSKEFASAKELAKYLLHLNTHPEEYLKFFRWKEAYRVKPSDGWCSLCTKLKQSSSMGNNGSNALSATKWYSDIYTWWYRLPPSLRSNNDSPTSSTSAIQLNENEPAATSLISSSASSQLVSSLNATKQRSFSAGGSMAYDTYKSSCLIAPTFSTDTFYSRILKFFAI